MSTTSEYRCGICGEPVDPNFDILVTAGSLKLFPVHRQGCSAAVRGAVHATRDIVERRFPALRAFRTAMQAIFKEP